MKRQVTDWERIFSTYISDVDSRPELTMKFYNSIIKNNPILKLAKDKHLTKEEISNKHIKRLPTSIVVRETQIKTTMKHHFIPHRTIKILKIDNMKCW